MNGLIASVGIAVVSSTGIWVPLQYLLTAKARRQQGMKDEADIRRSQFEALKAEDHRRELLSEAQVTAQRAALESAAERFNSLHADYQVCRDGIREVRSVAYLLLDVMSSILGRVIPDGERYTASLSRDDMTKARLAIEDARERLQHP